VVYVFFPTPIRLILFSFLANARKFEGRNRADRLPQNFGDVHAASNP
jgi:hypothetical protein